MREVEALSGGGAISCKLPPAPATFSAALEPKSNVALGDGIKLEVCAVRSTSADV